MLQRIIKSPLVFIYKLGLQVFGGLGLQKVWPLGAIRDWLSGVVRTYSKPGSVVFRGKTIYLDPNDNLELSVWGERHFTAKEIEFMESVIKPGDTVIDIGANIGLMTVFMAAAAGPGGHVFAFEPEPGNVGLLQKNVTANALPNVTITSAAVSDRAGKLKLFLSDFNPGDHRIYDPEERTKNWEKNGAVYDKLVGDKRAAIDVPVVVLDEFFQGYKQSVALIKMDVQGAEGGVLKGMMGVLKHNKDVKIIAEFWPAGLKMFGVDAAEFLGTLEALGFSFYEIENCAAKKPVSKEFLLQNYTAANNRSTNIVMSRK